MATQQQQQQQGRQQQGSQTQTRGQEPGTSLQRTSSTSPATRRDPWGYGGVSNPFSMMQRMSEEMDHMFQSFFGSGLSRGDRFGTGEPTWWPQMEVFQRGDKLVVRADVPGLKKDDINVELRENQLCVSGERKSESEEEQGQYYRSERSYGSFCRTIPLPEGAKTDTASAKFDNGVLEIEIDCPTEKQSKARRIEVRDASH